jgi:flagellin-like protein
LGFRVLVDMFRRERGLSNILTTLILLIIAVLLAFVVTYYSTNAVMIRSETEQLHFRNEHIWVNSTGAVAAFKLLALGGRDVLIDEIRVRGVEQSWTDVYYYRVPLSTSITGDMNVTSYARFSGASVAIDGRVYYQATEDIPLCSGSELLVYIKDPDNVKVGNEGKKATISIVTNNAKYTTELHVDTATRQ